MGLVHRFPVRNRVGDEAAVRGPRGFALRAVVRAGQLDLGAVGEVAHEQVPAPQESDPAPVGGWCEAGLAAGLVMEDGAQRPREIRVHLVEPSVAREMQQVAVPAPEEPADHLVRVPPARQLPRGFAGARRHRIEVHLLVQVPDEEHLVAVGTPYRRRRMPDVEDVLQRHAGRLLGLLASREKDGRREEQRQRRSPNRECRPGCFLNSLHGTPRLSTHPRLDLGVRPGWYPPRPGRSGRRPGTGDGNLVRSADDANVCPLRFGFLRSAIPAGGGAPRSTFPYSRPPDAGPATAVKGVPFWLREEGRRRMEVGPETRTLEPRTGRAHPKRRLRETGRAPAD